MYPLRITFGLLECSGIPIFRSSMWNENWFDRGERHDFWLELLGGSKNWGFKKLGFHCTCSFIHCTCSFTSRYIAGIWLVKLANVFPQLTFNFASWLLSSARLVGTDGLVSYKLSVLQDCPVKAGIIRCADDKDLFKSRWSMRGQPTDMLPAGAKFLCIWSDCCRCCCRCCFY